MGFHRRYISTDIILSHYKSGGSKSIFEMYTRGVDALVLNGDLASDLNDMINDIKLEEKEVLSQISRIVESSKDFK